MGFIDARVTRRQRGGRGIGPDDVAIFREKLRLMMAPAARRDTIVAYDAMTHPKARPLVCPVYLNYELIRAR